MHRNVVRPREVYQRRERANAAIAERLMLLICLAIVGIALLVFLGVHMSDLYAQLNAGLVR